MDADVIGAMGLIGLIILVIVIELAVVMIVAGWIASLLGVSGILWWCVAIIVFLLINGVLGALSRIGR